jgi:cytochrome c biogenesis protein ResB
VALWFLVVLALLVALLACAWARRVARKLEALTQSYWELRYDYTRLRSQVARLDPEQPEEPPEPAAPAPSVSFVPLASMKKKN